MGAFTPTMADPVRTGLAAHWGGALGRGRKTPDRRLDSGQSLRELRQLVLHDGGGPTHLCVDVALSCLLAQRSMVGRRFSNALPFFALHACGLYRPAHRIR